MSEDNNDFFTSEPFKFVIQDLPIYMHADLASRHSEVLDRMIHNGMKESQEKCAPVKDVDEGTFLRFVQWAYKGFYTAADFKKDEDALESTEGTHIVRDSSNATETEAMLPLPIMEDEQHSSWGFGSTKSKKKKKGAFGFSEVEEVDAGKSGENSFLNRTVTLRQDSIAIPPPRKNTKPQEDYTDVFLCHARVYVFADEYDIHCLKTLALEELQQTLAIFTLYEERTSDIIALLRYIYKHTGEAKEGVEDLRALMIDYVAYQMDKLIKDPKFADVLKEDEHGAMLKDSMKSVAKAR